MEVNKETILGIGLGAGLSVVMMKLWDKQDMGGDILEDKDLKPPRKYRQRSIADYSEDPDQKLAVLRWENEKLRRELVMSKTTPNFEDDSLLSNADVERLKMVFAQFDEDCSGTIPLTSLTKLCAKLGEAISDEASAFAAVDPDGTGVVSLVNFLFWWTDFSNQSQFILQSAGLKDFDPSRLRLNESGRPESPEYRIFFEYAQQNGRLKQISPWHDIPLFSSPGICNFICEIPKWTRAKYEIAVDEMHNPIKQDIKNGKLRYYKHGDMMFNYGAFPQTWENPEHIPKDTGCIGDNDPIDAVEIGMQQLSTGSVTPVKPLGVLALLDDNETDWKIVCININDPLARELNDVHDIEKKLPGALEAIRTYFRTYKVCTGKPENKFGLGGRLMPADYTMDRINECHEQWQQLKSSGRTTSAYGSGHESVPTKMQESPEITVDPPTKSRPTPFFHPSQTSDT